MVIQLDWKALIPEEPIGINTVHHTKSSHFYFDWLDRDRMVIRALTTMAAQEVQFTGLTKNPALMSLQNTYHTGWFILVALDPEL